MQSCGCCWGDLQALCYGKKMWVRHLEAPLSTPRGVCEGGEERPLHGIHYFRTHTTLPPPASNQHRFLIGTVPSHSIQNEVAWPQVPTKEGLFKGHHYLATHLAQTHSVAGKNQWKMLMMLFKIFGNASHVCSPNPTHVAEWTSKIASNIAWKISGAPGTLPSHIPHIARPSPEISKKTPLVRRSTPLSPLYALFCAHAPLVTSLLAHMGEFYVE